MLETVQPRELIVKELGILNHEKLHRNKWSFFIFILKKLKKSYYV
jgi:hypothetical protein